MKRIVAVLLEAQRQGARLFGQDGKLRIRRRGDITAELREELSLNKPDLIAALLAPRSTCQLVWREVAADIAARWSHLFSGKEDPPWLDPQRDEDLQVTVCQRIRDGDLDGLLEAAERWHREWLNVIGVKCDNDSVKGAPR